MIEYEHIYTKKSTFYLLRTHLIVKVQGTGGTPP